MLKKGDRVFIFKPVKTTEFPHWDPDMDSFNNTVNVVAHTYEHRHDHCFLVFGDDMGWEFNSKWCVKLCR